MSDRLPLASPAYVKNRARALIQHGQSKVLVLRARPRWTGSERDIAIEGQRVLVRPVASHLAALDALAERGPDDYLVLLTDLAREDLGDAVLVRTERGYADHVDEWSAVPGLFAAHTVDVELRRLNWVPAALLQHQPPNGWPAAPSGTVTADHALGNLLGALLGAPLPFQPDLVSILDLLDDATVRAAWQSVPAEMRTALTAWFSRERNGSLAMALDAAAQGPVSVLALGLALDVLWPEGPLDETSDQVLARGRIETHISGRPVDAHAARTYASTARSLVVRMESLGDPAVPDVMQQAEALLADLGWQQGAQWSTVLPAGLTARLRALADALQFTSSADLLDRMANVEGALTELLQHDLARPHDKRIEAARMAVRLARWICTHEAGTTAVPESLGASLADYLDDGAWVDRAVALVWDGTTDPVVAASYRMVLDAVAALRRAQDNRAAQLLAEATHRDEAPTGAVLIEHVLEHVVTPIAKSHRPLVILLDGMSAPVATEIAEAVAADTWVEAVPEGRGARLPVLAALPTLTKHSRTAFFTGELGDGAQAAERAAMTSRFGARLFHKDALRAPGGEALNAAVIAAINDPKIAVVGAVLNTIDDALDKHDPGGTRWGLDNIQHLRHLLDAAALAGRAVVLTSDHGHVVERGSEARPTPGADARWRSSGTGPVTDGEVLVRGRRVAGGEAVLAWREDLRYTSLRSGYHGGASLAEITVPFLLLLRGHKVPPGWVPAPPQAPHWWHESQRTRAVPGPRRRRRVGPDGVVDLAPEPEVPLPAREAPPGQGALEIEVTASVKRSPAEALASALVASEVFREQAERAGRHAPDATMVETVVTTLAENEGRAHRDLLASALGVTAATFTSTFAALRRVLNVEGYPVIAMDADRVTVRLDEGLLREQFELGGVRG